LRNPAIPSRGSIKNGSLHIKNCRRICDILTRGCSVLGHDHGVNRLTSSCVPVLVKLLRVSGDLPWMYDEVIPCIFDTREQLDQVALAIQFINSPTCQGGTVLYSSGTYVNTQARLSSVGRTKVRTSPVDMIKGNVYILWADD
jgi:hypothetical protein